MALKARDLNISIVDIPIPGTDLGGEFSTGKIPIRPWKEYQSNLMSRDVAESLFYGDHERNYAIITGGVSRNLVVIDIDHRRDSNKEILLNAEVALQEWVDLNPDLKDKVLIVKTGSGGFHIYVYVETLPEKNSVKEVKLNEKSFDIDI